MKKILLILIALIAPIHAANITWLGTSASAKTAANWVGGVLPAEGDVWVLSSTNSNAMTVDSNFTNAGISADAGYTATVSLQTYTIRTTGNVSLGGTVLSAGTSTLKAIGTSGTQAITSAGETWYDIIDSTIGASFSTSDNLSCHTFTKLSTSTGAPTFAGDSVYVSGDFSLDGASSPVVTMGTALRAGGASSRVHWGSGLGTVSAGSMQLYMSTSTAGVIDDDKGITFLSYTQGASAIVTNSGSATSTYTTTGTPITFTNSGNLTLTTSIICNTTGSVPLIAIAGTPTISGAGVLTIRSNGNGTTATIPAMNLGCTTIFTSNAGTSKTITFVGNLISTATSIAFRTEASAIVYNTGGYSITTNDLYIGSNSSAGTFTFNCGASDISITSLNNTYNTGSTTFDWGTSKISCSGPLNFGSTWAMTIGSAIFRYTGTGAATWTTNGKRIYDFRNVGSATAKLTLGDSLRCAYYYDSSGKFNQNGKTIYVDSNYTNVSPDSAQMSADIKIGKNYYRGTPTLVVRTAGSLHLDTSVNYKHLFTANGNQIGPLIAKRVAFQDSAKLQKLTAPDSSVFALKDGVGLRCDTLDTANFNGRSGKLNYWTADAPTAILWLPNALTASYVYGSNIEAKGYTITANNGNNVNGGGTVNWIWPTVSRNNIKKRFRFGLGFGF